MSMDNGNSEVENKFHRYKEHSRHLSVSGDFEEKVFAKIRKKKTQRKVAVSVTLGLVIAAFVFIAQLVIVQQAPAPTLAVQPEIGVKEEVPVMEDVIYASSDSRTNYAIGQVAYYEDQDSI